jgi:hypothetical protein
MTVAASVATTVSADEPPALIDVGFAAIVTVGPLTLVVTVTVAVAVTLPAVPVAVAV